MAHKLVCLLELKCPAESDSAATHFCSRLCQHRPMRQNGMNNNDWELDTEAPSVCGNVFVTELSMETVYEILVAFTCPNLTSGPFSQ